MVRKPSKSKPKPKKIEKKEVNTVIEEGKTTEEVTFQEATPEEGEWPKVSDPFAEEFQAENIGEITPPPASGMEVLLRLQIEELKAQLAKVATVDPEPAAKTPVSHCTCPDCGGPMVRK